MIKHNFLALKENKYPEEQNFLCQAYNRAYTHDECLDCGETIYNLICPNCISKEFAVWISNYPELKRKISGKINSYVEREKKLSIDSPECAVCKNNNVGVCPYCVTEYLLNLLIEAKAKKEILREYFELFNFDLGDFNGHWGYYKEGERLGVI